MDRRTDKDILNQMMKLAESYTPEWRCDPQNPDTGTALAIIYADMFKGTIRRFNRTTSKNMINFFNCIGAYIQPASASYGYVYFTLSTETFSGGVQVNKEIPLIAQTDSGTVMFQTTEELLATNSYIENIFLTNGTEDVMTNVYERGDGIKEADIFNLQNENLQRHEVYIYDRIILNIKHEAKIEIKFITEDKKSESFEREIQQLFDEKKITAEYFTDEGFVSLSDICVNEHRIIAKIADSDPVPMIYENDAYAFRLCLKNNRSLKDRTYSSVRISSGAENILPDGILIDGEEQKISDFHAFTEKPVSYMELYFASDDVFSKKGALVTVSFFLDFNEVGLENPQQQIEWKMIMKRTKLEPEPEYEISVGSVIWEYFNGYGWSRVFDDNSYSDIFDISGSRHMKKMRFICPDDIEKTVVGSMNSYFIRARVIKINNEFKTKGKYISPIIQDISLSYNYKSGIVPYMMIINSNTESEKFTRRDFLSDDLSIRPYKYMDINKSTVYLGFKNPPVSGPVKYLFVLKEEHSEAMPLIEWEYLSYDGWKNINIIDQTENLRKTGIITIMSGNDYKRIKMFGKDRYWIRITDVMGAYSTNGPFYKKRPVIENIFLNAVHVINVSPKQTELFEIVPFECNKVCHLKSNMQHDIKVMVNEINEHSPDHLRELEAENKAELVYDVYGVMIYAWVQWNEVRNFSLSDDNSRHYTADRNEGTVTFGNGINGHIPVHGLSKTIKIEYNCGDGSYGNVPAGMLNQAAQSLGIVSSVTNPFATYAGTDIESVDDAVRRNMAMFRSFGRGVTKDDFESLAIKADRNILLSRCISGINQSGEITDGCTVLVVLVKDYKEKNNSFNNVKENIFNYISEKINSIIVAENKFFIRAPEFVEYCVSAELVIKNLSNVFDIRSSAVERINEFLDPISGNYDGTGWRIGIIANQKQILNVLSPIRGVEYVKKINVRCYVNQGNKRQEVMLNDLTDNKFTLAVNGEHEIIITTQQL